MRVCFCLFACECSSLNAPVCSRVRLCMRDVVFEIYLRVSQGKLSNTFGTGVRKRQREKRWKEREEENTSEANFQCHHPSYVAMYCRMLPFAPVCCHVPLDVAICRCMLPCTVVCWHLPPYVAIRHRMLPCAVVCCHLPPYVAM